MRRVIWSYTVRIWQTTIDVGSKPRVMGNIRVYKGCIYWKELDKDYYQA